MRKHLLKFVVAVGLFAAGVIGITHTEDAYADTISLQVIPGYFEIDLKPGEVYKNKFRVINDGSGDVSLKTDISPYAAKNGEGGEYQINFNDESEYSMITNWTSIADDTIVVKKGEDKEVEFTITVPNDASGRGQYEYLSVMASSKPSTEGVSIAQNAVVGTVIYAKVDGAEVRRSGSISSHDINGFLFSPPISAASTVENKGNVHATAYYTLRVFPLFGGDSIYNNEDSPESQTLLPSTKRFYTAKWDSAPSIGIFKVESEVKIFDEVSKIEKLVIICPMWVLILVCVFILAVIFWIVSRVKSRKNAKE